MAPRKKKSKRTDPSPVPTPTAQPLNLILTSEKRRGFYECDYCRTDLSQIPRICCAICPEFDLCLECFTNPKASDASSSKSNGTRDGIKHDHTHGYRVCDSTRFFLFPSLRGVEKVEAERNANGDLTDVQTKLTDVVETEQCHSAEETHGDKSDGSKHEDGEDGDAKESVKDAEQMKEADEEEGEGQVPNAKHSIVQESEDEADAINQQESSSKDHHEETESPKDEGAKDVNMKNDSVSASLNEDDDNDAIDALEPTVDSGKYGEPAASTSSEKSFSDDLEANVLFPIAASAEYVAMDEIKNMWTVEEDLRLLDAIAHLGLGNWMDISEEVAGTSGTANKTPKKCMERYLYDYLGKYGLIVPQYTLVEVPEEVGKTMKEGTDGPYAGGETDIADKGFSSRKRIRSEIAPISRQNSMSSTFTGNGNKEYTIVSTETLSGYNEIWPKPYVPPLDHAKLADDVGRDLAVKAELAFVKAISAASSQSEANAIRVEWEKTQLNKHGGPTVLAPRAEDVSAMQGYDLAGYMPRRGDFDIEWDNDAEKLLQDMEFLPEDTADDRALKVKVLAIYNSRLDTREQRKNFCIDRGLLDYRKKHREQNKLPADERDLKNRMRLFARFQSPEEHEELVQDILKAKRLRKEIARLQMHRRMGFTSMADAERFELDRNRREVHRLVCEQKEKKEKKDLAKELGTNSALSAAEVNAAYVKQYKQNDRNKRNSFEGDMDVDAPTDGVSSPNGDKSIKEDATNDAISSEQNSAVKDAKPKFEVRKCPGYEILTKKELELCQHLELQPKLYTEAKTALIHESLKQGFLDEDNMNRRSIFKIDVEKREDVFNFILKSGWVPDLPKGLHGWQ